MRRESALFVVTVLFALMSNTGCSKPADNPAKQDAEVARSPAANPGAVAAVTRLVQSDLDAVPALINQLLSGLASTGQASPDQLRISYGGESIPVDWWLWNRGLIEFRGVDPAGQPLVGVSKVGMAVIAKPASWFTVIGTPDPSSACDSTGSLTNVRCTLKIVYAAAMNQQGQITAGAVAPIPMTVADTVNSDGKLWSADAIDYGAAGNPSGAVLNAMLGPVADRDAARQKYMTELAGKAAAAAPSPAPVSE
jgi:hypothetical protein